MAPNKYRISFADPKMGRPKTNKTCACTSCIQEFFPAISKQTCMATKQRQVSYADPKMGRPKTNKTSACTSCIQVFLFFRFCKQACNTSKQKTPGFRQRLCLFCREDRIRTCDPLVPNQVRYRPALLPVSSGEGGIRTLGRALRPYDGLANR
jgi:hypothetical protein